MALTREQKQKIIEKLRKNLEHQKAMVFVSIAGLKTPELNELREKLKKDNGLLMVTKKTLAEKVFEEKEIDYHPRQAEGEFALVFAFEDPILPIKTCFNFSKEKENLKILGGYFENAVVKKEDIVMLAKIPTRKELISQFIASLKAPIVRFINIGSANLRSFIYLLGQIKSQ